MREMPLLASLISASPRREIIHPNPGTPTLQSSGLGSRHTSTVVFVRFVASILVFADAPIGSTMPNIMIPTIVATFITVSTYSTSPYRRTFKLLKMTGTKKKTTILQICEWCLSFNHRLRMLSAPTSWTANPMVYANQYDHPQMKPFDISHSQHWVTTIPGERQRFARVTKPPETGRTETISPRVIL